MSDEIKVTVVDFGRSNLMLRYFDPMTGKPKHKSAGTPDRKLAIKAAGKWEAELREGRYQVPIKTTWAAFRERYEDEVLSGRARATDAKVSSVLNAIERMLSPQKLADVTAARLSHYQAKLREQGRSEATIKGNLAHIKAALSWAVRMGLLAKAPPIEMPKRAKAQKMMKGRPITGEEFDRMLAAVPRVVLQDLTTSAPRGPRRPLTAEGIALREAIVEAWKRYLRGLWWSGLRLAESLELFWDRDDRLCVHMTSKFPMLRIPAALEKGNQDRLLPMAPEFAELLLGTPEAERTGRVFCLRTCRVCGDRMVEGSVSRIIASIGKLAGVVVDKGAGKFATAHDLRRSFGERWAARLMPQQLMELMRHESIDTTMRYYVGRNAQSTAAILWEAHRAAGNTSGNTAEKNAVK